MFERSVRHSTRSTRRKQSVCVELANNSNGLYSAYVVPSATLPAEYKEDGLSVLISGDVTNNSVAIDGYISESEGNAVTLNGLYNTVEVTAMITSLLSLEGTKWKLVTLLVPFTPDGPIWYDYSKYDIVYEFRTNNVLTVSGETTDIEVYIGHEIGEHFYSIDNVWELKIDNIVYWGYYTTANELIIDGSPLDGYKYNFVKINNKTTVL